MEGKMKGKERERRRREVRKILTDEHGESRDRR